MFPVHIVKVQVHFKLVFVVKSCRYCHHLIGFKMLGRSVTYELDFIERNNVETTLKALHKNVVVKSGIA